MPPTLAQLLKHAVSIGAVRQARLSLPPGAGGTLCRVRIFGQRPHQLVELSELDDNPGPPVTAVFGLLASRVRTRLLTGPEEPRWVTHWPARSLAWLVLREQQLPARQLMIRSRAGGWSSQPLTSDAFARLLTDTLTVTTEAGPGAGSWRP